MINRTGLGIVDSDNPTFSVPCPVENFFWVLVGRLPQEIKINVLGTGYHNAGWSYLEVEVVAQSTARAWEECKRLHGEVIAEFQLR